MKGERQTTWTVPTKETWKPLLLGKKMDLAVQQYICKLHECGTTVTALVVQTAAEGITMALDRTSLTENGSHVKLREKSLLSRMNFTKRKVSTKHKVTIEDLKRW